MGISNSPEDDDAELKLLRARRVYSTSEHVAMIKGHEKIGMKEVERLTKVAAERKGLRLRRRRHGLLRSGHWRSFWRII